jgi:hypothetical protein
MMHGQKKTSNYYFEVTQSTEGELGRRSRKETRNGGKSVSDEDAVEVTVRLISKDLIRG